MGAIGYLRVSTLEQAESGAGMEAQRRRIMEEATRRGWEIRWAEDAGASGRSLRRRPALTEALADLKAGRSHALIVAKTDRLARSVADFAAILATSEKEGWDIVLLDLGVDTTTPAGKFVARTMANVAELESDLIAQRTREAMAVCIDQGRTVSGPSTSEAVRDRIVALRAQGCTYQGIADLLNAEGVGTARGGKAWHGSTVRSAEKAHNRRVAA